MDQKKGVILVLLTALISAVSIFINSYAVKGFDSSVFTFSKNIIVAIFLFSIIFVLGKFSEIKELTKKQVGKLALIGLIGGSIPFLLFFKGLQMDSGTTSVFIQKSMIIFVFVFAFIFLKEKMSKMIILGVSIVLIGTYLIAKPSIYFSYGNILVLIAVLFWAIEQIISKHALKELSANIVAFGRMFFGSFFILIFLFFTNKASLIFSMTNSQYLWILLTSIFLLGYVLTYYNGLKEIKVTTAVSILTLGMPITILLNYLFNGKIVSFFEFLGSTLIIVGIITIFYFSKNSNLKTSKELDKKYI